MAASRAVRISLERSARSVSRLLRCSSVESLGTILTATCDRGKYPIDAPLVTGEGQGSIHTCSPVSIFFASFTFPMLPAPIVFPRAHWPVGVVIVVRRLGCVEAAGRPCVPDAGCEAPARSATVAVMSALSR